MRYVPKDQRERHCAHSLQVYILDAPSRGRSAWQSNLDGPQSSFDALVVEQRFKATQRFKLWPQAHLHTKWPGNGSRGDVNFDKFYMSMVPSLTSAVEASRKVQSAGTALLDKIGVSSALPR